MDSYAGIVRQGCLRNRVAVRPGSQGGADLDGHCGTAVNGGLGALEGEDQFAAVSCQGEESVRAGLTHFDTIRTCTKQVFDLHGPDGLQEDP